MYRSSLISLIAGLTCIVALMGAPVECWQAECRVWVAINRRFAVHGGLRSARLLRIPFKACQA